MRRFTIELARHQMYRILLPLHVETRTPQGTGRDLVRGMAEGEGGEVRVVEEAPRRGREAPRGGGVAAAAAAAARGAPDQELLGGDPWGSKEGFTLKGKKKHK